MTKRKRKIIVITDDIYSKMIQKSLTMNVEVVLFLDFGDYFGKAAEDLEKDKEIFSIQLRTYVSQMDEIDFLFSFIEKKYVPNKPELADWVFGELERLGFPETKVLDGQRIYRSFYPKEKYRRILSNPQIETLDGIVLGISHAESGICSSLLPGRAANFATASQDLKIWEEFSDKVANLKYVIIDMFDYTYFNFESMLTGFAVSFFLASGIDCPKTFSDMGNKNICQTANELNAYLKTQWPYSNSSTKKIFLDLFGDMRQHDENAYCDYLLGNQTGRLHRDEIDKYNMNPQVSAIQFKIFEESIERNLVHFCSLLEFLIQKNPNIKIFLCLIPIYWDVETFERSHFPMWKEFFEKMLESLGEMYPFVYLDYKGDPEISVNAEYYKDLTHLNYDGSVVFTKKVASELRNHIKI